MKSKVCEATVGMRTPASLDDDCIRDDIDDPRAISQENVGIVQQRSGSRRRAAMKLSVP